MNIEAKHIPLRKIPNKSEKTVCSCLVIRCKSMSTAALMDEKGFKVANLIGEMMEWNARVLKKVQKSLIK